MIETMPFVPLLPPPSPLLLLLSLFTALTLRFWNGGQIERVWLDDGFNVEYTCEHMFRHACGFKTCQLKARPKFKHRK